MLEQSRPTRARGLKHLNRRMTVKRPSSRPTRARGLKHPENLTRTIPDIVAPHAGAWIETRVLCLSRRQLAVAPHAGAWIETSSLPASLLCP